MSAQMKNLYKLQKKDFSKAGAVLADAFQNDPFWRALLEDINIDQKRSFYEGSVRYGYRYGEAYATSDHLEGITVWVPSDHADMTFWRAIRSGSFNTAMKIGIKMSLKMKPIFEPLEEARRANMNGQEYIYVIIVGIAQEYQGQGFGRKLLSAMIEESEQIQKSLYLETTTPKNVKMYERQGFRVLNQITLPIIDLPQWGMVREATV